MNKGWIKLHRQLLDCWIWRVNEPFDKRSAWVDLLLTANHSDTKLLFNGEIITITRGQQRNKGQARRRRRQDLS